MLPPDLVTEPRPYDVYSYHRHLPDGELYLLFNRKDETRKFDVTLGAKGLPEQWDPMTGHIYQVSGHERTANGTRIKLTFAPYEMIVIVLRPTGTGPDPLQSGCRRKAFARPTQTVVKEIPVPGPFKFRTEQTITRPHIAWNFSQKQDGWKSATQPAVPDRVARGRLDHAGTALLLRPGPL